MAGKTLLLAMIFLPLAGCLQGGNTDEFHVEAPHWEPGMTWSYRFERDNAFYGLVSVLEGGPPSRTHANVTVSIVTAHALESGDTVYLGVATLDDEPPQLVFFNMTDLSYLEVGGLVHACRGPSVCAEHLDEADGAYGWPFPLSPEQGCQGVTSTYCWSLHETTADTPQGQHDVIRQTLTFKGSGQAGVCNANVCEDSFYLYEGSIERDFDPLLGISVREVEEWSRSDGAEGWAMQELTSYGHDPSMAMDLAELGAFFGLPQENQLVFSVGESRRADGEPQTPYIRLQNTEPGDIIEMAYHTADGQAFLRGPHDGSGPVAGEPIEEPGLYAVTARGLDRHGGPLSAETVWYSLPYEEEFSRGCIVDTLLMVDPCFEEPLPVGPGVVELRFTVETSLLVGGLAQGGTVEIVDASDEVVAAYPSTESSWSGTLAEFDGADLGGAWSIRLVPSEAPVETAHVEVAIDYGLDGVGVVAPTP